MNDMRKLIESLERIEESQEEELFPITTITSPTGDLFKFNAIRYNIVPGDLIVKIWYGENDVHEEAIEIEYAVLKRIIETIEREL